LQILSKDGVTFYVRTGNRLKFEARDVERILTHMRLLENTRLESKARLAGLLSQIGNVTYESRLREREEEKRRKAEEKATLWLNRRVPLPPAPRK
jgi:hypothetical protein